MAEKTFMSACSENQWHATDHEFSYFPNSFLAYYPLLRSNGFGLCFKISSIET